MTNTGMVAGAWLDGRNATTFGDGGIYAQNLNYNGTLGPVGINQISTALPEKFTLSQNYPNPFNGQTMLEFTIVQSGNASLEIFDMLGRKISNPVNENLNPGTYSYRLTSGDLPSGVYLYRLSSGGSAITKNLTILK